MVTVDYHGHEEITTKQFSGALRPAQVSPYCALCNVAWPCPSAAQAQLIASAIETHGRPIEQWPGE